MIIRDPRLTEDTVRKSSLAGAVGVYRQAGQAESSAMWRGFFGVVFAGLSIWIFTVGFQSAAEGYIPLGAIASGGSAAVAAVEAFMEVWARMQLVGILRRVAEFIERIDENPDDVNTETVAARSVAQGDLVLRDGQWWLVATGGKKLGRRLGRRRLGSISTEPPPSKDQGESIVRIELVGAPAIELGPDEPVDRVSPPAVVEPDEGAAASPKVGHGLVQRRVQRLGAKRGLDSPAVELALGTSGKPRWIERRAPNVNRTASVAVGVIIVVAAVVLLRSCGPVMSEIEQEQERSDRYIQQAEQNQERAMRQAQLLLETGVPRWVFTSQESVLVLSVSEKGTSALAVISEPAGQPALTSSVRLDLSDQIEDASFAAGRLWLRTDSNQLLTIDPTTGRRVGERPIPGDVTQVVADATGAWLVGSTALTRVAADLAPSPIAVDLRDPGTSERFTVDWAASDGTTLWISANRDDVLTMYEFRPGSVTLTPRPEFDSVLAAAGVGSRFWVRPGGGPMLLSGASLIYGNVLVDTSTAATTEIASDSGPIGTGGWTGYRFIFMENWIERFDNVDTLSIWLTRFPGLDVRAIDPPTPTSRIWFRGDIFVKR